MKTNAARILDRLRIAYELRQYEVDEADLSAETVARKVGLPEAQVFKTLLVRGDKLGLAFAVVPAGHELDLKALAKLSGDRKAELVPLKEVQPLTGYVRGGVTALGAKKDLPVYLDASARDLQVISVSAGSEAHRSSWPRSSTRAPPRPRWARSRARSRELSCRP